MTTSGATPTVAWLRTQSSLEFGGTISYDLFNLKLSGDLMFFQVAVWKIIYIYSRLLKLYYTHVCIYIYIYLMYIYIYTCIYIYIHVCVLFWDSVFSRGKAFVVIFKSP